jgi:uncharacterized damage-inducible protein DinB
MEAAVAPLASILELNTDLLLNCLTDLSEPEAQARLPGGGNSITFLAAHLTDTRHYLVTQLGSPLDNPLASCVADARGFDDIRTWPSLAELRNSWLAVSRHLRHVLDSLGHRELTRMISHRLSLDGTQLGLIAFLTQHDAYHLGQIAFLRRQLGKPAMVYTRGAN